MPKSFGRDDAGDARPNLAVFLSVLFWKPVFSIVPLEKRVNSFYKTMAHKATERIPKKRMWAVGVFWYAFSNVPKKLFNVRWNSFGGLKCFGDYNSICIANERQRIPLDATLGSSI